MAEPPQAGESCLLSSAMRHVPRVLAGAGMPCARADAIFVNEICISTAMFSFSLKFCLFRQGWQRRPVGGWHCMSTGILSLKIVSLSPGMAAPSCRRMALHVHRNIVAQDCVSFARGGSAVLREVAMRHVAYLHICVSFARDGIACPQEYCRSRLCLFCQGWQRRPKGGGHATCRVFAYLCLFRQGWHCMSTGILSLKIVSLLPGMAAP